MSNKRTLGEYPAGISMTWVIDGTPSTKQNVLVVLSIIMISLLAGWAAYRHQEGNILRAERQAYIHSQQLCEAEEAWYVHSEDYHGLISCHYWPDETYTESERFWMVPETGLVMFDESMLPD
jgi:hypothetical protein